LIWVWGDAVAPRLHDREGDMFVSLAATDVLFCLSLRTVQWTTW
jgi:hypothetical protein